MDLVERPHSGRVDVQDLASARLVGKADLDLDLQSAGSQQGVVDHVLPVGHADHEDVVELLHAVDLREQLVDHGVVDARVPGHGASGLADGIDLVEYDYVQAAVGSSLMYVEINF